MNYFIFCVVFIFGLTIGSFINCLIYRLYIGNSFLRGRSFCPKCKHGLAWHDNIPLLSFFMLNGRCRYCRRAISMQYPAVELITAILFTAIFVLEVERCGGIAMDLMLFNCSFAQLLKLLRNWVFTFFLIIIFVYDLRYYLILDKVTVPAMMVALVFNLTLADDMTVSIFWLLAAGSVAGGFFLIQFLVSKGKWIGGGDIYLGFLMGFMLGWPQILIALFVSYIVGSVVGIGLILSKRKTIKSEVPFGTFLSVGTFVTLMRGDWIIEKYLNLL